MAKISKSRQNLEGYPRSFFLIGSWLTKTGVKKWFQFNGHRTPDFDPTNSYIAEAERQLDNPLHYGQAQVWPHSQKTKESNSLVDCLMGLMTNCRPCRAACSTLPISSCSQWRQPSCRSLCLSGWPWWWSLSAMLPQNSTTNTVWTLLVSQSSSQHFMEVCWRICFMEKIEYPRLLWLDNVYDNEYVNLWQTHCLAH